MASRLLSRVLPTASDETLGEAQRQPSYPSDLESAVEMAVDEENLGERFQDQDVHQLLAEAMTSEPGNETTPPPVRVEMGLESGAGMGPRRSSGKPIAAAAASKGKTSRWTGGMPKDEDEDDDDVPESLMLEPTRTHASPAKRERIAGRLSANTRDDKRNKDKIPFPIPGPINRTALAQWNTTQERQRLYEPDLENDVLIPSRLPGAGFATATPKERAMWKWANVENLDNFLASAYVYFDGHGVWSICLRRTISLLTVGFVLGFSSFLIFCIDYSQLPNSHKLSDIRVPKCGRNLPLYWNIFLWVITMFWCYTAFEFARDIPRLIEMRNFYHHVLEITEIEIQTTTWQHVVARLMALRDSNSRTADQLSAANRRFLQGQSKQRMDAHDIANRLMRKDNYWIAMVNRDLLDTNIHIPFFGARPFFSRTMEWNLGVAINEFVFDEDNQIRAAFLATKNRSVLVDALKRRFLVIGVLNCITALPTVIYFVIVHFFREFMQYQRNPAELGTRGFTPLAEWKIREFNELPHLFQRRLTGAYPYADYYLEQFPKDKTEQLAKFVSFVAGGLGAVLGLVSMFDPELFLGFEIDGRTVLFWLGAFGAIWKLARGLVRPENMEQDPEYWLGLVNEHTHYCPASWVGRLNTYDVHQEFSGLYRLEIVMFLEEVASVILTPFLFIFIMHNSAEQIIDFFREFTVHVDGLGHVCSFAVFDFRRGGEGAPRVNMKAGDPRTSYYKSKDEKLTQSVLGFQGTYAAVPKKGHHPRQAPFNHPPPFPGVLGSTHSPATIRHSFYGTPRFGPAQAPTSHMEEPMQSVLLDPHNQPRSSPRQNPHARSSRGTALNRHQVDAEEGRGAPHRTSSAIIEEDTELGDSWAVRADAGEDGVRRAFEAREPEWGIVAIAKQIKRFQTRGGGINM